MSDARATVAHYTGSFLPLTEGWIYDQIRHCRSVAHIVLAKRRINESCFPWPAVYTARSMWQEIGRGIRGFYPALAAVAAEHGTRLLHAHFGNRGIVAVRLAQHLRIPLVTSFYGRDLAGDGSEYAELFAEGALFLAEGPAARERLIEIGCHSSRIRIHRLGVDPSCFAFRPRVRHHGEPLRILMAGRFTEKKGFVDGVRAFCDVARELPLRLTIAGDAGRAPEEQAIKREMLSIVREAGLEDRIEMTGFIPLRHLIEVAMQHHLVLQPSVVAKNGDREGGHPVVLTQLAATGMPAIATGNCDLPEVVIDGVTGWICPERRSDVLAGALRAAYGQPEVVHRMSFAARELVERKYDIRKQTLDPIYEELLAVPLAGWQALRPANTVIGSP